MKQFCIYLIIILLIFSGSTLLNAQELLDLSSLKAIDDELDASMEKMIYYIIIASHAMGVISLICLILTIRRDTLYRDIAIISFFFSLTVKPVINTLFDPYMDLSNGFSMLIVAGSFVMLSSLISLRLIDLLAEKIDSYLYQRRLKNGENIY